MLHAKKQTKCGKISLGTLICEIMIDFSLLADSWAGAYATNLIPAGCQCCKNIGQALRLVLAQISSIVLATITVHGFSAQYDYTCF